MLERIKSIGTSPLHLLGLPHEFLRSRSSNERFCAKFVSDAECFEIAKLHGKRLKLFAHDRIGILRAQKFNAERTRVRLAAFFEIELERLRERSTAA